MPDLSMDPQFFNDNPNAESAPTESEDKGAHYRRFHYKGVKFDPYRVAQVYDLGGGPREHMTKKLLRGTEKGHTELDLVNELQSSLDRWKEMLEEDS